MRRWLSLLIGVCALGLTWWWFAGSHARSQPEAPERYLFRKLIPNWVVARSRSPGVESFEALQKAAAPWPQVKEAIDELEPAWPEEERIKTACRDLNAAARDAGLEFWVDPMFVSRNKPILTTYEVLERVKWSTVDGGVTTEAIHVRRLDRLNLELGLLGHASGSQPAILRDRMEVSVIDRLRVDPDEYPNAVDELATKLWRAELSKLVDAKGLDEAERRVNLREKLLREMEKRLKGGQVHVERPQRLVFGDEYFETLEPFTSTRRRGGPLFLASDLRALQRADEALGDSADLPTLVQVIDLEARVVEAHEVRHAIDQRELPVPALLQRLVGEGDLRFGRMSERELRAFIGQLHDSKPPACLTVIALAQLARGTRASATPHFFAAHTLLATLADAEAERGLTQEQVVEILGTLCALSDAELRGKAEEANVTLYGEALPQIAPK
ncbi:MAG: hypothetical protein QM817_30445 [Archangium sp.]